MVGHHALPKLSASSQLRRLQTSGTSQAFFALSPRNTRTASASIRRARK